MTEFDNGRHTSNGVDIGLQYVHLVRKRFADQPEKFAKFSLLLSDISQSGVNKIDVVLNIVSLLIDQRDLLDEFLQCFVPEVSYQDITEKLIVLHMRNGTSVRLPIKQRAGEFASDLYTSADVRLSDVSDYIRRICTLCDDDTYRQFQLIVQSYKHLHVYDIDTITRVIILFWKHPELVFGLQRLLPTGHKIVQCNKFVYELQHSWRGKHRNTYFMVDDHFTK